MSYKNKKYCEKCKHNHIEGSLSYKQCFANKHNTRIVNRSVAAHDIRSEIPTVSLQDQYAEELKDAAYDEYRELYSSDDEFYSAFIEALEHNIVDEDGYVDLDKHRDIQMTMEMHGSYDFESAIAQNRRDNKEQYDGIGEVEEFLKEALYKDIDADENILNEFFERTDFGDESFSLAVGDANSSFEVWDVDENNQIIIDKEQADKWYKNGGLSSVKQQLEEFIKNESDPRNSLELYPDRVAERLHAGEKMYQKQAKIHATVAHGGETINTVLSDGTEETTNTAQAGDYIVTNPGGEQYVIKPDVFHSRYASTDHEGEYQATGKVIAMMNPTGKPISLQAPWGEMQYGGARSILAVPIDEPTKPYIIGREEFDETYGGL